MMRRTLPAALVLALGSLVAVLSPALAQHMGSQEGHGRQGEEPTAGHSHMMSQVHGGHSVMTAHHHFEVLFTSDEVRVYVYDGKQNPMMEPKGLEGSLELRSKKGKQTELELNYVAPDEDAGRMQGYYAAAHDFSETDGKDMKALVTMKGLADEPVEFKTEVDVSEPMTYACPMNCVAPVSDPMSCPKCGMEMEPAGGGHHTDDEGHEGRMNKGGHGGH